MSLATSVRPDPQLQVETHTLAVIDVGSVEPARYQDWGRNRPGTRLLLTCPAGELAVIRAAFQAGIK